MIMSMNQNKKISVFNNMSFVMVKDHRLSYRVVHRYEMQMKKKEKR